MTTVKYKIVEFDDKSMSIVPRTWLHRSNEKCWWPPFKQQLELDKAIIEMTPPKSNWADHYVYKIRGHSGKLEFILEIRAYGRFMFQMIG